MNKQTEDYISGGLDRIKTWNNGILECWNNGPKTTNARFLPPNIPLYHHSIIPVLLVAVTARKLWKHGSREVESVEGHLLKMAGLAGEYQQCHRSPGRGTPPWRKTIAETRKSTRRAIIDDSL
jgi:hypothetical protein